MPLDSPSLKVYSPRTTCLYCEGDLVIVPRGGFCPSCSPSWGEIAAELNRIEAEQRPSLLGKGPAPRPV